MAFATYYMPDFNVCINIAQASPIATTILAKPDPAALHLAEDSEDDEESCSWKR